VVADTIYGPGWTADRDYWIAKVSANCGNEHDSGTHPDDGAAQGGDVHIQLRRTLADLSGLGNILASDTRVKILEGHHQDSISNGSEGVFARGDFNISRLFTGDIVHPKLGNVGDGGPAVGPIEITMHLVPYPWPGRE
jgi:hypothetical protein